MRIPALLLASVFVCAVLHGGDIERMRELTKEIQILNLLNGFELTEQQTEKLKKHAKKVENLEEEFERYLESNVEFFETGLKKSIEILAEGKSLPPSLKKDISFYNQEVKRLHSETEEEIFEIAQQVEDMLEPQQIQQLKDYVPCLIPPTGKLRIGQSGSAEGLIVHLERIRELPEDVYRRQRESIIEKALERRKIHTALQADFDEDEERERIGKLLDSAREMSDVDFTLNKELIVEEFKGVNHRKNGADDVARKIRSFLLDPIILKYL